MKTTLITSDDHINLEIPLTKADLARLKAKTPEYMEPEDYAEMLILDDPTPIEQLELTHEQIARIRRDVVTALIEHAPTKDATYILKEAIKLVNYCINK